jgi:hypothetical protein
MDNVKSKEKQKRKAELKASGRVKRIFALGSIPTSPQENTPNCGNFSTS